MSVSRVSSTRAQRPVVSYELGSVLRDGEALLIVPPFAPVEAPSREVHLLQARARAQGLRVSVLYANLMLAKHLGETPYRAICASPPLALIGERFFATSAYGLPPFGFPLPGEVRGFLERTWGATSETWGVGIERLRALEERSRSWADAVVRAVVRARAFPIIGCTSQLEQTAASVALLNRVKVYQPAALTLLGGDNCVGEKAEDILSLGARIDFVFSGHSEQSFPRFLSGALGGELPSARIIRDEPGELPEPPPTLDFSEYFEQHRFFLGEEKPPELQARSEPEAPSMTCS